MDSKLLRGLILLGVPLIFSGVQLEIGGVSVGLGFVKNQISDFQHVSKPHHSWQRTKQGLKGIVRQQPAKCAFVLLHGLADSAEAFTGFMARLVHVNKKLRQCDFYIPSSPVINLAIFQQQPVNAWFDIYSMEEGAPEDRKGALKSGRRVRDLVEELSTRIDPANIGIAGFSMGGALSLITALDDDLLRTSEALRRLGGVFAASAWIPMHVIPSSQAKNMPIRFFHCLEDNMVKHQYSKMASNFLLSKGYTAVTHTTYRHCTHSIPDLMLIDFAKAMSELVP